MGQPPPTLSGWGNNQTDTQIRVVPNNPPQDLFPDCLAGVPTMGPDEWLSNSRQASRAGGDGPLLSEGLFHLLRNVFFFFF